jgi:hypothetical protein
LILIADCRFVIYAFCLRLSADKRIFFWLGYILIYMTFEFVYIK